MGLRNAQRQAKGGSERPAARAAPRGACSFEFNGGFSVRWIYLAIVVLIVAATLVFALQNLQIVGVSFLASSLSAPLALLVFVVYVLGAATGGSLYALLRRSVQGSRRAP